MSCKLQLHRFQEAKLSPKDKSIFFSPAKQLLSFPWCRVLLSHLTHHFDYPENEQNREPCPQGLPEVASTRGPG